MTEATTDVLVSEVSLSLTASQASQASRTSHSLFSIWTEVASTCAAAHSRYGPDACPGGQ